MNSRILKQMTIALPAILVLMMVGFLQAQEETVELSFREPPASHSDQSRTLQSLVKVRDISESYSTGGLYLITHYGDREALFREENQKLIDNPILNQTWRFCSVFSSKAKNSVIMGRNWDNQNVGSIIVSLYHPPKGYSSVSISRAIDLGFPENLDLEDFKAGPLGERLLLAPFYAMDGMNEYGLAVSVAGVRHVVHKTDNGKERLAISFLIRKILDQTKTIDEAVSLAEKYVPFLLDKDSLDAHLFVADSSGRSVVLEYDQDKWSEIFGDKSWQVLTNKPVYHAPEADLKGQCWRYRSMSGALEKSGGDVDWRAGLQILRDVRQNGTTWSVVYSPTGKELYLSVYQTWDKIYHIKPF